MKKILLITLVLAGCTSHSLTPGQADSLKRATRKNDSLALTQRWHRAVSAKELDTIENDIINNTAVENQPSADMPTEPEAQMMAHQYISAQSIDPGEVDFISETEKFAQFRDSSYVFTGNAKMLNRYSQKIIMGYNLGIKWLGGDWNKVGSWSVKFSNIGDPN